MKLDMGSFSVREILKKWLERDGLVKVFRDGCISIFTQDLRASETLLAHCSNTTRGSI